jgi:hypothetical protein
MNMNTVNVVSIQHYSSYSKSTSSSSCSMEHKLEDKLLLDLFQSDVGHTGSQESSSDDEAQGTRVSALRRF